MSKTLVIGGLAALLIGCTTIQTPRGVQISTGPWSSVVMRATSSEVTIGVTPTALDDNVAFSWGDAAMEKTAGEGKKANMWYGIAGLIVGVVL